MADVLIRAFRESDLTWAVPLLDQEFGGRLQARRGELHDVLALPGLVATIDDEPAGLLTYRQEASECELALLWARRRHHGIGTALVQALQAQMEAAGCSRIWAVTTNDNLDALRFYQRRGFVLCALRAGAVDDSRRRLKPQISLLGGYGIPLRDELELESVVTRTPPAAGSAADLPLTH
ncbi:MAG: GNAT family N-acetyltransferase [Chloroflexota bacterium]